VTELLPYRCLKIHRHAVFNDGDVVGGNGDNDNRNILRGPETIMVELESRTQADSSQVLPCRIFRMLLLLLLLLLLTLLAKITQHVQLWQHDLAEAQATYHDQSVT
jgi:hypothetical protein